MKSAQPHHPYYTPRRSENLLAYLATSHPHTRGAHPRGFPQEVHSVIGYVANTTIPQLLYPPGKLEPAYLPCNFSSPYLKCPFWRDREKQVKLALLTYHHS
ncbi:hypothetical protein AVEN_165217-1 [Araneus ventricosus]|uniref:Uncharacterized protein n=1 Tax=Araneus ventricosus TaxID=182803 RepID=A0A4Y2B760_ARAVE|nr:hypothetical protein AVEN_165217-1 [Araneus ventricosus]